MRPQASNLLLLKANLIRDGPTSTITTANEFPELDSHAQRAKVASQVSPSALASPLSVREFDAALILYIAASILRLMKKPGDRSGSDLLLAWAFTDNRLDTVTQPGGQLRRLLPVNAIELPNIKMQIVDVILSTGPNYR